MTRSDIDRMFTIIFIISAVIFFLIYRWLKKSNTEEPRKKEFSVGKNHSTQQRPDVLFRAGPPDIRESPGGLLRERGLIILMAIVLRLIFAMAIDGFPNDIACFKAWSQAAADDFAGLYSKGEEFFLDYPPGYMYVLFFLGTIRNLFSIPSNSAIFTLIIKTPAIIADVVSGNILYHLSAGRLSEKYRLFVMSLYLFNPVVFFLSTIWGQIDSIVALLILAACIYLSREKYELAAVFFAIGVLVKPQGIIFLPILFFECLYIMLAKREVKRVFIAAACFAGTFVFGVLPFSLGQSPLWIIKLYLGTLESYNYASMNAYNFFSLLGANFRDASDTLLFFKFSTWGLLSIVMFTALTGFVTYMYHKKRLVKDELHDGNERGNENGLRDMTNIMPFLGSALLLLGVTTFAHKMHERYFFPALLLLLAVYCLNGGAVFGGVYILASTAGFFNSLLIFSKYYTDNLENMTMSPAIFTISALTVFATVIAWLFTLRSKGEIPASTE
ncbi:MAG: glycosyltransferase 87 family protein [Oscillospiraceae bacterium]|nr:glycosyltransferase 87 family protein [Oscillospiraceae bacterium]